MSTQEGNKLSCNSIGFGDQLRRRMVQPANLRAGRVAAWRPVILVNFVEIEVKIVSGNGKRDVKLTQLESDRLAAGASIARPEKKRDVVVGFEAWALLGNPQSIRLLTKAQLLQVINPKPHVLSFSD